MRFESLEDIRRQTTNVAATCAFCGHRGIVDGAFLWRWFALHRWNSRPENIIEHMRCSVCRRRPSLMEATDEAPTVSFGPRDEREWQQVVARLRRSPPRASDWRSEARRGGKECVRTCLSRWSPFNK